MRRTFIPVVCLVLSAWAVPHRDTTLFVIQLNTDSTSLYYCNRDRSIRDMLSGPVLMGSGRFLFYSTRGYVLYDSTGTVIDSHNVALQGGVRDEEGAGPVTVAGPIDTSSLLYYRTVSGEEQPHELFRKRILKKLIREVKDDEYPLLSRLVGGVLMNIARNTATDEMARRVYLAPRLVGYSSPAPEADRWWSLDKFYSFSSPLIHERDSMLVSFFPGIGAGDRALRSMALDVIGTYVQNGTRMYVGVSAPMGSKQWRSWQTLYFCDEAGNVVFTDSIPKQSNQEIVLGKDHDPRRNVVYTTRATKRFVFPPVVDNAGAVCFGMVDYEFRKLAVRRRTYPAFAPSPCRPDLAHLIDIEKDISYEPIAISCDRTQRTGAQIPQVRFTDSKGNRRAATARDLARGEFLARIARQSYRDVESKLARRRSGLPPAIDAMRDSLSATETAGCPYT
ncbi:MAG: hypothetical protein GF331_23890, partial [Chitinivibrionales bacterium]|nr:hypothetical protein [Chitinivibrionales bacterium]